MKIRETFHWSDYAVERRLRERSRIDPTVVKWRYYTEYVCPNCGGVHITPTKGAIQCGCGATIRLNPSLWIEVEIEEKDILSKPPSPSNLWGRVLKWVSGWWN